MLVAALGALKKIIEANAESTAWKGRSSLLISRNMYICLSIWDKFVACIGINLCCLIGYPAAKQRFYLGFSVVFAFCIALIESDGCKFIAQIGANCVFFEGQRENPQACDSPEAYAIFHGIFLGFDRGSSNRHKKIGMAPEVGSTNIDGRSKKITSLQSLYLALRIKKTAGR